MIVTATALILLVPRHCVDPPRGNHTIKTSLNETHPSPAPTSKLIYHIPDISVSEIVRLVKSNSSKWINEQPSSPGRFGWQSGYGAFSVSLLQLAAVCDYVRRREEHHRKKTFREEYQEFLKRHDITFEEKYLWG